MLRRSGAVIAAGLLLAVGISPAAWAEEDSEPLYKYEKAPDGSYGYGNTPVEIFPGSGEQVTIPAELVPENRRMSSAWVATIANLNFGMPSDAADFTHRYDTVLDDFESWNMNAVIFQVRPLLDAFYPSDLNPWSEFLTGTQGEDPGYDPLATMVEATHARGMEFHAWLNPYRVTNTKLTAPATLDALGLTADEVTALTVPEYVAALAAVGVLSPENYAVQNPEHVLVFDEKLFLDPGIPEVRASVAASVAEIVANYDVDAIHFDDYFYPYRITVDGVNVFFGDADEDRATFELFGSAYPDTPEGIEAWRRDNITALMTDVGDVIRDHNATSGTAVQFGVSPFGIWEHKELHPDGSNTPTSSSQTYSGAVFADTRAWALDELVDYVVPQIYWSFDQAAAPYGELARWWDDIGSASRTHIYTGHALYKHVSNGGWDPSWMNPEEVGHQIRFNQTLSNTDGSVLFSYNDMQPSVVDELAENLRERHAAKNAAIEQLRQEAFAHPTIVPAKPWLSDGFVAAPERVSLDGGTLTWDAGDVTEARTYAIYRGTGTPEQIVAAAGTLVDTVWAGGASALQYDIAAADPAAGESVVVTALDAAAVESAPVLAETPGSVGPGEPGEPGEPTPSPAPTSPATPSEPGEPVSPSRPEDGDLAATGSSVPVTLLLAAGALLTIGAAFTITRRRGSTGDPTG